MTEVIEEKIQLPDSAIAEIEREIAKYPSEHRRSAVMATLRIVQENHENYLNNACIKFVADYLGMPAVSVQEVATFYTMYNHEPVGKHMVSLCTNVSCQLKGCGKIEAHLKKKLGVGFDGTSADGKFTLKEVECLGACIGAPMMQVDKDYHENLTPERVDEILDGLK